MRSHEFWNHQIVGRVIDEDVRRCITHVFPYGILYTIEQNLILIVAVMHFSREPDYWKHRIPKP
jgi:toxin ParE1/3/4